MNNNSDTLCPDDSQEKEIEETIFLCRQGLLPLLAWSRYWRWTTPLQQPQNRIF
jgi:hypothetical protein